VRQALKARPCRVDIPFVVRIATCLIAAALALVAAGCGGGEPAGGPPLPGVTSLRQVAVKTEQAGSYRFDMTLRMSVPGAPAPFEISAHGAVDEAGRRATMSMDFGSLGDLLGARGVSGDDLELDVVFEWPVAYMRVPFLADRIPGGKSWVKMDLEAVARKQGIELPSVASFGQSDPSAFLDFLRAAGDLRTVGKEQVQGVRTTHYLARIDLQKFAAKLPAKQREQLAAAFVQLEQLTQNGQLTPLVDAWVDGEGLLRRFEMSFSVPAGSASADVSMAMDLHDFGAPVDVRTPEASDVAEITQLAG
jgi:hypothetical protein